MTSVLFNAVLWSAIAAIATAIAAGTGGWALYLRTRDAKASAEELKRYQTEAGDRISTANARAEEAKKTADGFQLQIAHANERAAAAQEKAAQFNEIAERERLARIKLEEKLMPRTITHAQAQEMKSALAAFAGAKFDIFKIGDTVEVSGLGMRIESILKSAGWQVGGQWTIMGGVSGTGVAVFSLKAADSKADLAAQNFVTAFLKTGLSAKYMGANEDPKPPGAMMGPPWDNSQAAPIRIFIGEKP